PHSGPTPHTKPGIRRCPGRLGRLVSCVLVLSVVCRYQNINWLSIDYACRPRLRSRLTQGGLAWPWNPWSSGGRASHPSFSTHACILTRDASTTRSHGDFTSDSTLPYPTPHHYGDRGAATTSAVYLAPLHYRRPIT